MLNRVQLIGHLGDDPENRKTPGGASVTNFRIATNESWIDKNGVKQERTQWHKITVWGKQADFVAAQVKKGALVYVDGKLEQKKFQEESGKVNHFHEIQAADVKLLSRREETA